MTIYFNYPKAESDTVHNLYYAHEPNSCWIKAGLQFRPNKTFFFPVFPNDSTGLPGSPGLIFPPLHPITESPSLTAVKSSIFVELFQFFPISKVENGPPLGTPCAHHAGDDDGCHDVFSGHDQVAGSFWNAAEGMG